ncbi:hypothetical protein NMG60_11000035 [Bertholletia excelsa]
MDDEKKKRKNKKKKNKQTKTIADVTHGIEESANEIQNNVIAQNHHNQVPETTTIHNDALETDMDLDKCSSNGTIGVVLAEADKLEWADRVARLLETVKELQKENDGHIQKEASLEEAILKLQKANDTHLQNEASLEGTIKRLQKENDTHLQKAASLEMKLVHFHGEKEFWLQKQADFEKKIDQLTDKTGTLSLQRVSLEEKIKQLEIERDSWVQKENSMKETIASLNNDNTRLQAQVIELGESRNRILQENQHLTESISDLQSQIQNLQNVASSPKLSTMTGQTCGDMEINAQMEVACQLVEKLVVENAELVEKVNELYVELDKRETQAAGFEPTNGSGKTIPVADPIFEFASGDRMDSPSNMLFKEERNGVHDMNVKDIVHIADSVSEMREKTSLSSKRMESLENVATKSDSNQIPIYPDTIDSEEIVQIPLDNNEVADAAGHVSNDGNQMNDVPLTDAPLTGAPFRLISFVARYVSGADLVNKSSVRSNS